MNFAPVAFLDTFDLVASLRTKMGLFRKAEDGILELPVRGPSAKAEDPDDDTKFVRYREPAKWVELQNCISRIRRIGEQMGGIDLGRVRLELLPPATCLPWALDEGAYNARFARALLPLRTNPAVTIFSSNESWSPAIGYLTIVNRRVPNSAIRPSPSSCATVPS